MLTQLQEKCFYQHCLFQLGFKEEAVWKNCQKQLHLHSNLHKGCPKNAPSLWHRQTHGQIKDRSCKFGSGCPEIGKSVPVLTGFPFSCQHWPWSTPKMSSWLPLYQIPQMWCDHRAASARSAQGQEFLLLSEHTGWKLSWKIKITMCTWTFTLQGNPVKLEAVEKRNFCCRRGIFVGPWTCSVTSDAANTVRLSCT